MKTRLILAAMTTATLAVLAPSVPATAATSTTGVPSTSEAVISSSGNIHIVASGTTRDGGWVAYTGTGSVRVRPAFPAPAGNVSPQKVENKAGGIWDYGAGYNAIGKKACHSYYSHDTRSHGSSVSMGGSSDSEYVSAGQVSFAYVQKYTNATCYAYYRF